MRFRHFTNPYFCDILISVGEINPRKTKFKKEVIKMKRKFFVINETGGYFGGWEEELCKAFCKANGYTYRIEYRDLGY